MKSKEPNSPCFLFTNPNIKPASMNKTILINWIKYGLTFIPLLYCKIETIIDVIKLVRIKKQLDINVEIIIFFICSPKVYIFNLC